MMYDDDDSPSPSPKPVTPMHLYEVKRDVLEEVRDSRSALSDKIAFEAECLSKTVKFYARGGVFFQALAAVLVGGYILKYWL